LFLVPSWPVPPGVRALCSTRAGGVSRPPYDSLNVGDHVGDDPKAVLQNREIFARALHAQPVFLRQVHGRHVVRLTQETPDGIEADGCVAAARGVACTVMVADCLPVLFATADGMAVAAAHAGWRGLAGGIIEAACEAVRDADAEQPRGAADVIAWLGPCIGPGTFEVGSEVKEAFEAQDAGTSALFELHAHGKWLADLPGLARRRLAALGITRVYGNDGSPEWCTVSNPSKFFSHRRDRVSGRFAASIWLA